MLGAWDRGGASGWAERVERIAGGQASRSGPLVVSPAPTPVGETWCLIDGELYDAGAERLLEAAGPGCFDAVEGSFAAIAWDGRRQTATLACDPLGLGRLYVCESPTAVAFATSVPELLGLLAHRPVPDAGCVSAWLERAALPPGRTVLAGVRRLRPGEWLEFSEAGIRAGRHRRPAAEARLGLTADDAAAQVRTALGRAVRRRCDGERSALLLSGGLDSSALAAVAVAELEPARLPAIYSLLFPRHPAQHEARWIDLVTGALGLDSVRMEISGGSVVRGMLEWTGQRALPLAAPNYFYQRPLLGRMAADGVSAVLDGEGGDELFANPRFLVADRLRASGPLAAWSLVRAFPGAGQAPRRRVAEVLWRYGVRGALPHAVHRSVAGRGRRRGAFALEWGWQAATGPRWAAHARSQLTDGFAAVGAHEHFSGRAAAAGLRARHPLRDLDLVELVLRLPPELAFDPRRNRPLLRRSVRGLLPEPALARTDKAPFDGLVIDIMSGPDLPLLRRLLDPHEARVTAYAGPQAIARARDPGAHPGGLRDWAGETFRLAAMECWLRWLEDPEFAERALEDWRPLATSARFEQHPAPASST